MNRLRWAWWWIRHYAAQPRFWWHDLKHWLSAQPCDCDSVEGEL